MAGVTKYKIVLVRHGESLYNLENRFCGWHDADLSPKGIQEAHQAGKVMNVLNLSSYFFHTIYLISG